MKSRFSLPGAGFALLAASLIPAAAMAAESDTQAGVATGFHYALSAGATHTDNAGHTSANQVSETSADAGFSAGIEYVNQRSAVSLDADLQYRMHSRSVYGNELLGGLAARASHQLTRNLAWVAEDNLGQSLINAQNSATPDNTQNVNFFSTGPDLMLPLTPATSVNVQGRWSDVSYADSDSGNRRLSATLGLQRQLNEHSSLSLNGSTERVEYKELPPSNDYDIRSAYLGWKAEGARTRVDLTAGYTKVDEGLGESSGGSSYGLEVLRKMTARSDLSLSVGRSFGDSADALRRDQGIGGVSADGQPATISAGPLKSDYATVNWNLAGTRSLFNLSANWRREDSLRDASLDRDSFGGGLKVSRRVSERLSLDFSSDYKKEDFDTTAVRFSEWRTGVGMTWALTSTLDASTNWEHVEGSGDSALGSDTRNFTENRYSVRFVWSPGR